MSDWVQTDIGKAEPDAIIIRGRDLAGELMGEVTFTELAFLLVQGREATPGQTALLDAVLVSLADHGLTPTALAARLTYTGAPESLQGAVAAGLLGAGTVFLGVVEDTAALLEPVVSEAGGADATDDLLGAAARAAVEGVPGGGRADPRARPPGTRQVDPRTPRVYEIAEQHGCSAGTCAPCGWSPSDRGCPGGRCSSTARAWPRGAGRPRLPAAHRPRLRSDRPRRRPRSPPGGGDRPSAGRAISSSRSTAAPPGSDPGQSGVRPRGQAAPKLPGDRLG